MPLFEKKKLCAHFDCAENILNVVSQMTSNPLMAQPSDSTGSNPLREGLISRPKPQPCTVVIFGASGDLTYRKLIPALYNIAADGDLPAALSVVGFARREKTDESFRDELEDALKKFSRSGLNDEVWKSFSQRLFYHRSEFGDPAGYKSLAERLNKLDEERGTRGNRLFYL